jgi:hypothetical protein
MKQPRRPPMSREEAVTALRAIGSRATGSRGDDRFYSSVPPSPLTEQWRRSPRWPALPPPNSSTLFFREKSAGAAERASRLFLLML